MTVPVTIPPTQDPLTNGWYCTQCQQLTEHHAINLHNNQLHYICTECGNSFRAPSLVNYTRRTERGLTTIRSAQLGIKHIQRATVKLP